MVTVLVILALVLLLLVAGLGAMWLLSSGGFLDFLLGLNLLNVAGEIFGALLNAIASALNNR